MSNFAWRFIGIQGRESHIFRELCSPRSPKSNKSAWPAHWPIHPIEMRRSWNIAQRGRTISKCGYRSVHTDVIVYFTYVFNHGVQTYSSWIIELGTTAWINRSRLRIGVHYYTWCFLAQLHSRPSCNQFFGYFSGNYRLKSCCINHAFHISDRQCSVHVQNPGQYLDSSQVHDFEAMTNHLPVPDQQHIVCTHIPFTETSNETMKEVGGQDTGMGKCFVFRWLHFHCQLGDRKRIWPAKRCSTYPHKFSIRTSRRKKQREPAN